MYAMQRYFAENTKNALLTLAANIIPKYGIMNILHKRFPAVRLTRPPSPVTRQKPSGKHIPAPPPPSTLSPKRTVAA